VYWFWLIAASIGVVIFLMWAVKPALNNFRDVLAIFNISITHIDVNIPSTLLSNLLFAVIVLVIEIIVMAGIALVIAVFIATLTSLVFSPFTTRRVDTILVALRPIAAKNHEMNPTDESKKIIDDISQLSERWGKSRFNNFIRRTTTKREREKFDTRKV